MHSEHLHQCGLRRAAAAVREGDITGEALVRALLDRIALSEDAVQAFEWLDSAGAVEAARAADRALREGHAPGVLQGMPIGVKDIIATRGVPTRMGSPIFRDHVPADSADVVARIEAAGAYVFGKTVTTEFAYYTPGKTRNPWNLAHTPGGSSSGSAAAVAAGFLPAAVGTQTNGSVVRPAAFCGVVGYKPSGGSIPARGVHPFSPTLDQVGVFARSLPDAALLASVLAAGAVPAEIAEPVTPPRLAAVRSPVWGAADAAMQTHFLQTIERLRACGAQVAERELPTEFNGAHAVLRTIMTAEGARTFAELQRAHHDLISPRLNALIDEGLRVSDAALAEALERRRRLQALAGEFLEGFDAIVTPPTTGEAPRDLTQTGDPTFCTIWSLCATPAVTIPTGAGPHGLPLGLQIVSACGRDAAVLAAAEWCDRRVGRPERVAGSGITPGR
jgi:Asp-tRNA(Asn)/Glu-tRNA(Gln) amidotransferase A subunit family amidase